MLVPHDMKGQVIGVLGLGRSGLAAIAALRAAGTNIFACDDIKIEQNISGITITEWQHWPWDRLDTVVISPGIPHRHPKPHPAAAHAYRQRIEVISEVELALRAKPKARLVAITGTNGKSTTTALIGHCLHHAGHPVAIGGNLGNAACSLQDPGENGTLVLELSSYQLETTPSLAPSISILLNITPDHLDRHGGMNGYIAAKSLVLERLSGTSIAIIGAGDEHVKTLAKKTAARGIKTLIARPNLAPISQRNSVTLAGKHNAENAAAAALALQAIGLDNQMINCGIASFTNLPHRLQRIASCGNIQFINDSKATNSIAAANALAVFDNVYWIAGGLAKHGSLAPTIPHLQGVKKAYLIGTAAKAFATDLAGVCPTSICGDLEYATRSAFLDASTNPNGGTILLAPAAASFDQFSNFSARGNAFSTIARDLCANGLPRDDTIAKPGDNHA